MTIIIAVLSGIAEGVYMIPRGMKKEFSVAVFILLTAIILQVGSNSGVMTLIDLMQQVFEPVGRTLFVDLIK